MGSSRRSPPQYRSAGTAIIWFVVCLIALIVGALLFYYFVVDFDYQSFVDPNDASQAFLPPDGYQPQDYPELAIDPDASPTPHPMRAPQPTPVPVDSYAILDRRMMLPDSYDTVIGDLTECRISTPDDNHVLVLRGYGYMEGRDAFDAQIYMVVSANYSDSHRFYQVKTESGSTGLLHDATTGRNLDQSDFVVNIRVDDTYQEGEYRLGLLVINREDGATARGYTRLSTKYNFLVSKGRITGFAE